MKSKPPIRILKYPKARMIRLSEETDADLVTLATMAAVPPAVLGRQLIEAGIRLVQESASEATTKFLRNTHGLSRAQRRELERRQR